MTEIHVTIPGKPIPAARPRVTRYGTYIPKPQQEYMEILKSSIATAMRSQRCSVARTGVPVELVVSVYIPWAKGTRKSAARTTVPLVTRPDGDNFLKMAMDSGNAICWADDSQIWAARVEKWRVPRGEERLDIRATWEIDNRGSTV
jgi:Holliday junction resolvase RusA-like endonuclease